MALGIVGVFLAIGIIRVLLGIPSKRSRSDQFQTRDYS